LAVESAGALGGTPGSRRHETAFRLNIAWMVVAAAWPSRQPGRRTGRPILVDSSVCPERGSALAFQARGVVRQHVGLERDGRPLAA
jgi:hypothetical protein